MINITKYKDVYVGDGSTTEYSFTFQILDKTHILVYLINDSNTVVPMSLNSDYTVSGTGNSQGDTNYTSGTITFIVPPTDGYDIIIRRQIPKTNSTGYLENDNLPASTLQNDFDRLTLQIQDLQEQIDRCIKADYTQSDSSDFSLPTATANYYIRFNSTGDGLVASSGTPSDGLDHVSDDPDPTLGGDLKTASNRITAAGTDHLTLETDTGEIRLNAETVTVEQDIVHSGDSDTKVTFGTNTISMTCGNTQVYNLSSLGLQLGASGSRVTTISSDAALTNGSSTALVVESAIKSYVQNYSVFKSAPVLGGNLDVAGYSLVTSASNYSITIDPHGSGSVIITVDSGGFLQLPSAIRYSGDLDTTLSLTTDSWVFNTNATARLSITNSGVQIGSGSTVSTILDEDAMGSDSATALATQQSIKAYVDNKSASQAQMEAGSSTNVYVSPGVAQYHPSAAKFWVLFDSDAATISVTASYNVTGLVDNGVGDYTITINNDFSGTGFTVSVTPENTSGTYYGYANSRPSAGTVRVRTAAGGTLGDPEFVHVIGFGDR